MACGLVSSDVADFTFKLPEKSYSFDTASLGIPSVIATLPAVACTTDSECACPTGVDCTGLTLSCRSGACAAVKRIEVPATVNLATEAPEFRDVKSQHIAKFEFKELDYQVKSTLGVELPAVDIYMAQQGATSSSDPTAQKLGSIPATPPNASLTAKVVLVPGANDIFTQYASDWATPFAFIAVSEVVVKAGDPIPTGKVDFTVWGYVTAKPSL